MFNKQSFSWYMSVITGNWGGKKCPMRKAGEDEMLA